jgi:outer membrane lipoprotein-sorting protein
MKYSMMRRTRSAFALLTLLVTPAVVSLACAEEENRAEEAFEEMQDEMKDAGDEIEDEIDDHS